MARYVRPLVQTGLARPDEAETLAGGWGWFTHVEILMRDAAPIVALASDLTDGELSSLTSPRPDIAGLSFD